MKRIDDVTIEKLYQEFGTPEHVKRHCFAVTKEALKLANALNAVGYSLDTELIYGAGMVHDMARVEPEHWNVAADKLEELGYDEEAAIVRVHMVPDDYSPIERVTERDMICLGDRLVREDEYVGIDLRFEYIMDKARKFGVTDFSSIFEHKEMMQKLLGDIERVTGKTIDEISR